MLKAVLENKAVKALVFLSILITSILEVMRTLTILVLTMGSFSSPCSVYLR